MRGLNSHKTVSVEEPKIFMWYIYIIQCRDGKLYTGITNNLNRRLTEHNLGRGCRFTRSRKPVKLVYCQKLPGKSEALRREIEIKKLNRSQKLDLVKAFKTASHKLKFGIK